MALKRDWKLKAAWKWHRRLFKLSGGRIGTTFGGLGVLLLTTTGRKSGEPRSVTLTYRPAGDSCLVVGSNAGHDKHALWYLNLKGEPKATVMTKGKKIPVVARELEGEEYEREFAAFEEVEPGYAAYRKKVANTSDRHIPIIALEPVQT